MSLATGRKMSLTTGHKIVPLSAKSAQLAKLFTGRPPIIQVEPSGWILPTAMQKYDEEIVQFQFEESDVIVMTLPKSGTTWVQELVWTMKNNANFDHPMASQPLTIRSPFLEYDTQFGHVDAPDSFTTMFEEKFPSFDNSSSKFLYFTKNAPRPRTIKTHMSFPFLSSSVLDRAKVVYVIRDPRDVCISYHHYSKVFKHLNYEGSFDQYVDAFMEGAVWLGPHWIHVGEAWSRRDHPNLHIIFYEQLKKHNDREVRKLAKFLGTDLTDGQIEKIIHYTSFTEMKKRNTYFAAGGDASKLINTDQLKNGGGFFRQGTSGGWKDVLTQAQKNKFQLWIEENCPDMEIMRNITEA